MTVIAYRNGIMAADTGTWSGNIATANLPEKIYRTKAGDLLACAGRVPDILAVRRWIDGGERPAATEKDAFGGLLVRRESGLVERISWDMMIYPDNAPFQAEGACDEFLLGAMAAGATAEEAIRLALRHVPYAAGEVQVVRLGSD